jgi:hypothetical protein
MKSIGLITFALFFAMPAISDARPSARRTVRLADDLRTTAEDWARDARRERYRNTHRHLIEIADLASEVEVAARGGSISRAKREIDRIVSLAIHLRVHIRDIPDSSFRRALKRELANAINALGSEVFESDWIRVRTVAANSPPVDDFDVLQNPNRTSLDSGEDFANDLSSDDDGDTGVRPPDDSGSDSDSDSGDSDDDRFGS